MMTKAEMIAKSVEIQSHINYLRAQLNAAEVALKGITQQIDNLPQDFPASQREK